MGAAHSSITVRANANWRRLFSLPVALYLYLYLYFSFTSYVFQAFKYFYLAFLK